jgi:hypothetical protein
VNPHFDAAGVGQRTMVGQPAICVRCIHAHIDSTVTVSM